MNRPDTANDRPCTGRSQFLWDFQGRLLWSDFVHRMWIDKLHCPSGNHSVVHCCNVMTEPNKGQKMGCGKTVANCDDIHREMTKGSAKMSCQIHEIGWTSLSNWMLGRTELHWWKKVERLVSYPLRMETLAYTTEYHQTVDRFSIA